MASPVGADAVVVSVQAQIALDNLRKSRDSEAAAILRRLGYLRERLLLDCQDGEVVPCPLPRRAAQLELRHGRLQNLYCCDLPGFWRLLYTIVSSEGRRYVAVLEVVPHEDYYQWFRGKGR